MSRGKNDVTIQTMFFALKLTLFAIIGLAVFPIMYLAWGIHNLTKVNRLILAVIVFTPFIIIYEYCNLFILAEYTWSYKEICNILFALGVFFNFFFIMSRLISVKIFNNAVKIKLSAVHFIFFSFLYLSPIVILHILGNRKTPSMYVIEVLSLIWVACVTYIFVRLHDDELFTKVVNSLSRFTEKTRNP